MGDTPHYFNDPESFRTNNEGGTSSRPLTGRDPDFLIQSARSSQPLMDDAKKVVDMIASSKPFSTRLMAAAQASQMAAVTGLIKQTGIKTTPDIKYNPDGIRFDFYPKTGNENCHIIINLRWSSM